MATMQELLDLANQAAAEGPDMTEAVKGGGGGRLLPPGTAFARLIEVVELGQHAQEYQGMKKDPALEVQLGFALWGEARDMQGNVLGQYHEADGTPTVIRPYSFAVSRNEKARAFLLFKALNWKNTAKSFGQLLGQTFLVSVVHEAKSKTDATVVSRIDLKSFHAPLDITTGMPYNIPDVPIEQYRLFLWSRPTKEGWDALHIEGKYDDGKSKNFVQEKMMAAVDFMGSPLQQLLFNAGVTALPTAPATAPAAPPAAALPASAPAPMTPPPASPAALPVAPGVAPVAPLAPPPVTPVAAAAPQSPVAPVSPVSPVSPSVTPVGLPTTFPSNPVAP